MGLYNVILMLRDADVFAVQLRKPKLNTLEFKLCDVLVIESGDESIRFLIGRFRKHLFDLRAGGRLNNLTLMPEAGIDVAQHHRTWKQLAWPSSPMQSGFLIHCDKNKFAIGHFSVGAIVKNP
ncbi:hypothetical protein RS1P1_12890 [Pseudomonas moraviensis]|nr:hypothetical protein RS1P1_12890 [Pseudomonas moraviensis]